MILLPEALSQFLENAIECDGILVLPQDYPQSDNLEDFQSGYKVDAITKKDITGYQQGDFQPSWYVVSRNYFLDPFFINIDEEEKGFPVYFAPCGQGKWQPILASASLSTFNNELHYIKKLEDNSAVLLDYLEANTDIANEFWREVHEAVVESNNDDD